MCEADVWIFFSLSELMVGYFLLRQFDSMLSVEIKKKKTGS